MASKVTTTPIYRDMLDMVMILRNQRKNIAVVERFFWSDFVLRSAYELLGNVHKAYGAVTATERAHELRCLSATLSVIETYLRIAREDNVITIKASSSIWLKIDSIGKQLNGWIKATKDSMPEG